MIILSEQRISYDKIKRRSFFLAGIPFSDGEPLDFFVPCLNSKCTETKDYCGMAVNTLSGFGPEIDPKTGRQISPEVNVIVKHKARLVIVMQLDHLNQQSNYHHVIVVPVYSLDKLGTELKKQVLEKNDIPLLHYINNITGKPAYIDLADIKRIHKSLLLESKSYAPVSNEEMNKICQKLSVLLDIKKIAECETCDKRCDNCEYRKASSE